MIAREEAPPPIATTLFRLTERGEQLRPVLQDLTRWGVQLMAEPRPDDAVRSHWLASALEMMLSDRRPREAAVTIQLLTGDQPIVVEAADGAIHTWLGQADDADATLSGPPMPILGLLLGRLELSDAKAIGLECRGDVAVLDRVGADVDGPPGISIA